MVGDIIYVTDGHAHFTLFFCLFSKTLYSSVINDFCTLKGMFCEKIIYNCVMCCAPNIRENMAF